MRYLFPFFFFLVLNSFGQEQENVDFTKIDAEIKPYQNVSLSGIARYDFNIDQPLDSLVFDAIGMEFSDIYFKGKKVTHLSKYDGKQLKIGLSLGRGSYNIRFGFTSQPKQTVYFIGEEQDSTIQQIWTQGQGKYTSHWLPSFDNMNEKLEFDLTVHVPPKYNVIANGKLKSDKVTGNLKSYKYDMNQPMSSYLAAFVIGNFSKEVLQSSSGIPIELYYEPKDSLKVEPTYRYTKQIFDFLEEEIGVAYPWQNYKQVPVQDFLYAGMENTTCTIFSNQYVIDSTAFLDKNYVNVNAHELAHQWFGNLVTEVSGEHHWLHEGFATYYAYLTEKELFGDDHFYWSLYETARTLHTISENGDGEALTNPNAGSLTFYEKGAWALAMLRERLGDKAFKKGMKSYLTVYAYKNATITDFLNEMEKASGSSLLSFREEWLDTDDFPWVEVSTFLKTKNPHLNSYFEIQKHTDSTTVFNQMKLKGLWNKKTPKEFKRQFIFDYWEQLPDSSIREILKKEPVEVRQAVALVLPKFPKAMQSELETLLTDPSYITQETTLFKLWEAFPENRADYLNKTKAVEGLPNKNVRLLWLALALVTPDYQISNKTEFSQELKLYTAPQFNFEIRQGAFQYLTLLNQFDIPTLKNLLQACDHHVWQFKKSSRNLVRELYAQEDATILFEELKLQLSEKEKSILEKVINR